MTEQEKDDIGSDEVCVVRMNPFGPGAARIVTNCDVSDEDIALAIKKLKYVVNMFDRAYIKNELNGEKLSMTSVVANGITTNGGYQ